MSTLKRRMVISTLAISSFFMNLSVHAALTSQMINEFNSIMNDGNFLPPASGQSTKWANGTVTREPNNSFQYTNGSFSMVVKTPSDLIMLAEKNADVRNELIKSYGVDVLSSADSTAKQKAAYEMARKKLGAPGSKTLISPAGLPQYYIKYDGAGNPALVVGPDGKEMSFFDFEATSIFAAMTGKNESQAKDLGAQLPAMGSIAKTLSVEEKEKRSKELTLRLASIVWGVTEVQGKKCQPVKGAYTPTSLKWFEAVAGSDLAKAKKGPMKLGYYKEEKMRDEIIRDREKLVKKRMEEIEAEMRNATASADLQVASYDLQIEHLNLYIDSFSGTSLFSMDVRGADAAKTARIPTREALYLAAAEAATDNNADSLKNVQMWNESFIPGMDKSREIASKACARTKTVCDGSDCHKVADPVPGSCQMGQLITTYQQGPVRDYSKLYLFPQVPSIELNERMERLEGLMKELVSWMPTSNDANYDWTSPLVNPQTAMFDARKTGGIVCPSNVSDSDYDKSLFANIAPPGNDPILELGRYALGRDITPEEYEKAVKMYNDKIASGSTPEEAKKAMWGTVIETPEGKNYYSKLADGSFLTVPPAKVQGSCTSLTCNSYKGEKRADIDLGSLGAEALNDSARGFLKAYGIIESSELALTTDFFNRNWIYTDLVLGQPGQRTTYFNSVQGTLADSLDLDRDFLNTLLTRREELIKIRDQLKATLKVESAISVAGLKEGVNNASSSALDAAKAMLNVGEGLKSSNKAGGLNAISGVNNAVNYVATGGAKPSTQALYRHSLNGENIVRSLSANSNAIMKKIDQRNKGIVSQLKKFSQGAEGSSLPSMASSNALSEKASKMYGDALKNNADKFFNGTRGLSKDMDNALAKNDFGSNSDGSGSTSSESLFGYSARGGGYAYSSPSSKASRSPSSAAREELSSGQEEKDGSGWSAKNHFFSNQQDGIELFDTISKAYQRVGLKRLEVD